MTEFLAANWLWIAIVVFFVAMHRGGHGCGMHRGHGHQHVDRTDKGPGRATAQNRQERTMNHHESGLR